VHNTYTNINNLYAIIADSPSTGDQYLFKIKYKIIGVKANIAACTFLLCVPTDNSMIFDTDIF
jgi:hypothetical protein